MRTYTTNAHLKSALDLSRARGQSIAFVPTMGNLHQGHLQLVKRAKELADIVVVSIFVNPLQFGPNEDIDGYPRTMMADKEKLFSEGVQMLFAPESSEIYPEGMENQTLVTVPDISETLCGAERPGHFQGVATVVSKLFNIVRPDKAVFGQKDFQQLAIIRKMVIDLCLPIEIISVQTARAEDGLALSSRNGYLTDDQRAIAPVLHQILLDTRDAVACGFDNYEELERHASHHLQHAGFGPGYFALRDARTLRNVTPNTEEIVIAAAARLGDTRLIDNITFGINPAADWQLLAAQ
ncbi:MAG: pantoate--beta-alanine ligase [Halieaceae bacterium]|jgi:pantoate--beta-alanine ligase